MSECAAVQPRAIMVISYVFLETFSLQPEEGSGSFECIDTQGVVGGKLCERFWKLDATLQSISTVEGEGVDVAS